MTNAEFDLFLSGSMGLCALFALINLIRLKKRGASAIFLSLSFLAMGLFVFGMRSDQAWDQTKLIMVLVIVGIFLVLDVLYRSKQRSEKEGR